MLLSLLRYLIQQNSDITKAVLKTPREGFPGGGEVLSFSDVGVRAACRAHVLCGRARLKMPVPSVQYENFSSSLWSQFVDPLLGEALLGHAPVFEPSHTGPSQP